MMKQLFLGLACVVGIHFNAAAQIKLGMVLPLTGPLAATGADIAAGTQAFVAAFNASGGAAQGTHKGQKIELIIEDDAFDPIKSEALARSLIRERGVSALLSCFGTVNCLAIAKVAEELKVPLIGPIAGAPVLRNPDNRHIFSLRADAVEEVGALVTYLKGIGQNQCAVVVQDDGFGKAYAGALKTAGDKVQFSASTTVVFDPKTPDYAKMATALLERQPASILLLANTVHSIGLIKALNAKNYTGQVLNLAGQANGFFVKSLAGGKQMAVFPMMTPSPTFSETSAATDYRAAMDKTGQKSLSYLSFEAYLNARLTGAVLRRASNATPGAITATLQGLNELDLGVFKVSFSGNKRQGASYTDLAVLTTDGRFRH